MVFEYLDIRMKTLQWNIIFQLFLFAKSSSLRKFRNDECIAVSKRDITKYIDISICSADRTSIAL